MMRGGMQCHFSQGLSSVYLRVHPSLIHMHRLRHAHTRATKTSEICLLKTFIVLLLLSPFFLSLFPLSSSLAFFILTLSLSLSCPGLLQPFLSFCITPLFIFPCCSPFLFIHPDLAFFIHIFLGFRHVALFLALLLLCFPGDSFVGCGSPFCPCYTNPGSKTNEHRWKQGQGRGVSGAGCKPA